MSRFVQSLSALFPITALAFFGYMALCGLDYGPVVEVEPAKVITPAVRQGEFFKTKLIYTRIRTCEFTRIRVIIDGSSEHHEISREYFPGYGNVTDPSHPEEMEVKVLIGPEFAPGPAKYRAIMSHECPLRLGPVVIPNIFAEYAPKVTILPDVSFTILPAKK